MSSGDQDDAEAAEVADLLMMLGRSPLSMTPSVTPARRSPPLRLPPSKSTVGPDTRRAIKNGSKLPLSSSRGDRFRAKGSKVGPLPPRKGAFRVFGSHLESLAEADIEEAPPALAPAQAAPALAPLAPAPAPPMPASAAPAPPAPAKAAAPSSSSSSSAAVEVRTGSADDVQANAALPTRLSSMINEAYGTSRVDPVEIFERLRLDGQEWPNRVLHLAYRDGALVGCCSSTVQPGWTEHGVGQWGLLAVEAASRGTGVASALVAAAESRLRAAGCTAIQIEYDYAAGDVYCERLRAWYEGGKLSFVNEEGGEAQFRRVIKRIAAGSIAAGSIAAGSIAAGSIAEVDVAVEKKQAAARPRPVQQPSALGSALPPPPGGGGAPPLDVE